MRVFLIRHLEPLGARGRCYGRTDLPPDPAALAAGTASIRARVPAHALEQAPIFTSPLARCRELARRLAAPREPAAAHDLIELDFGAWEGADWDCLPREELDAWARDVWRYRPGGGESADMAAHRWRRWASGLAPCGAAAAVAVTHAGIIRVALACSGRMSPGEAAGAAIAFGSVHEVHT